MFPMYTRGIFNLCCIFEKKIFPVNMVPHVQLSLIDQERYKQVDFFKVSKILKSYVPNIYKRNF